MTVATAEPYFFRRRSKKRSLPLGTNVTGSENADHFITKYGRPLSDFADCENRPRVLRLAAE